jgi:hypothetical protein
VPPVRKGTSSPDAPDPGVPADGQDAPPEAAEAQHATVQPGGAVEAQGPVSAPPEPAEGPEPVDEPAEGEPELVDAPDAPAPDDGPRPVDAPAHRPPAGNPLSGEPELRWEMPGGPTMPAGRLRTGPGVLSTEPGHTLRVDDVLITEEPQEVDGPIADRARVAARNVGIVLKES